jgi:carbamoyl-phosphate synthase large subunit
LFTCVGRRVVLINAFRRAMEELGVTGKLFATDVTPASSAMQIADRGFIVPLTRNIDYIPTIKDIVRENDIGLIVPLTDLDLRSLARHCDEFSELGCTVMVASEPTIKLCRDKKSFSEHLIQIGLSTIRTFTLGQFRAEPFYPCFVKPVRGSAGLGTAMIKSGQELRAHVHTFGDQLLLQDYVPGQEFTVDVYRTREGEVKAVVPRQRLLVRSGEVDQGITIYDQEIIDMTLKLVDIMDGLWGVFCCQCRRPAGEIPHFFELNPRFGGGAPLSLAAGVNLPLYLLQEILGLPITAEFGKFKHNLLMMRYAQEITREIEEPSTLPGFKSPIVR